MGQYKYPENLVVAAKERIRKEVAEGTLNITAMSTDLKVPRSTLQVWKAQLGLDKPTATVIINPPTEVKANDVSTRLEEFGLKYDYSVKIPTAVKDTIQKFLIDGKEVWCTDQELQRRCGITNSHHWKIYARENPELEAYLVVIPGNGDKPIWCDPTYREQLQRKAMSR